MTYRHQRRTATILMLLTIVSAFAVPHGALAVHAVLQMSDAPGPQLGPRTDGSYVVWLDYRNGDIGNPDLYGRDLESGHEFDIALDRDALAHPDIDDGIVVWSESRTCNGCDYDFMGTILVSGESFEVAVTSADEAYPAISGNWVVWVSTDETGSVLMARDIASMSTPVSLASIGEVGYGPAIDGTRVVWEDLDGEDEWRLFTIEIGDPAPTLLATSVPVPTGAGGSFGYDVAGDVVVYVDSRDFNGRFHLEIINVETNATTTINTGLFNQQPTTDGRYIILQDHRFPEDLDGRRVDLRGYDLWTNSEFTVSAATEQHTNPDISDGTIVWSYGTDIETDIYAMPLSDALPSSRRPDPGTTSTGWQYFPLTGHYLGGGFDTFWTSHGGLPVFGYPLTEEFLERNPDTQEFYTVQYVERQRFEWHPENEGTPYNVLLGRLGAQLLDMQGRDWTMFATADPGAPHYFEETKHAIGEEFYSYWSSHGLEFGDPGVTYRESLALFGLPLSEPMIETNADGDTVLTQYFERAVFEFHPDNPAPYQVLLRRVGAELLIQRDW